ncbi:hypothetical protein KP79_PYT03346 [Mizuhopecten yessoensis]|uniref:Uncharacterized protein n=2 Tax=Mizuhopecten yessoensis TaxID=6573 RepID=A0A210PDI1_MIZYE|nr:hypothetical protein KP79_PYT03346 [Mizuhopecten yessoensis]
MAEAGKPDSSAKTKQEQNMEATDTDETLLQDALILQNQLDSSMKLRGKGMLPLFKHPSPADEGDEEEITRRCNAHQEREKTKERQVVPLCVKIEVLPSVIFQ